MRRREKFSPWQLVLVFLLGLCGGILTIFFTLKRAYRPTRHWPGPQELRNAFASIRYPSPASPPTDISSTRENADLNTNTPEVSKIPSRTPEPAEPNAQEKFSALAWLHKTRGASAAFLPAPSERLYNDAPHQAVSIPYRNRATPPLHPPPTRLHASTPPKPMRESSAAREQPRRAPSPIAARADSGHPAPTPHHASRTAQQERLRRMLQGPDFDGRKSHPHSGQIAPFLARALARTHKPPLEHNPRTRSSSSAPHIFRPLDLRDWIGPGPLKPPEGELKPPTFDHLKPPQTTPDGVKIRPGTPDPAHLEDLTPPDKEPDYPRWELDEGQHKKPHWHMGVSGKPYYHEGRYWGREDGGRWTWMREYYHRWWAVADGAQRLVRHADHWWWKTQDGWFLLHEGQPWSWRYFEDWKQGGLIHPQTGTRILYSADGLRVAVVTPGSGSVVFDAQTGRELAAFPEMPSSQNP